MSRSTKVIIIKKLLFRRFLVSRRSSRIYRPGKYKVKDSLGRVRMLRPFEEYVTEGKEIIPLNVIPDSYIVGLLHARLLLPSTFCRALQEQFHVTHSLTLPRIMRNLKRLKFRLVHCVRCRLSYAL